MESSNAAKWKDACDSEVTLLRKNKTWELVPLPQGRKAIGCRWVSGFKENQAGEIDRFMARLVAKSFSQKYGVDYEETFAPVTKFTLDSDPAQFVGQIQVDGAPNGCQDSFP